MLSDLPCTSDLIAWEVGHTGGYGGVQLDVRLGGAPVGSLSGGDAVTGPMTDRTLIRVYCAIKPITAVAVARLVDAGCVELDTPLAGLLPTVRALAEDPITLRHVLTHTAGLHNPGAFEVEVVAPRHRPALFEQSPSVKPWRLGIDAGYSECFGWHLLGRLLETVTGEPLREHLRGSVLEPLGMTDTWIGMTAGEFGDNFERIGLNYDQRTGSSFPVLLERSEHWCTEVNPAHGGYTTARDLTRFYAALAARYRGADIDALPAPATLRQFCSNARPTVHDVMLGRCCAYGLGFMTSLEEHHFGRSCSPRAFGHSGWLGGSFGFADPDHDLAATAIFNRIIPADASFVRRPSLVAALYEDLGLGDRLDPPPDPQLGG